MSNTIRRGSVIFIIILVVALIGGVWVAGAEPTIAPDATGGNASNPSSPGVQGDDGAFWSNAPITLGGGTACVMVDVTGTGPHRVRHSGVTECWDYTSFTVACTTDYTDWSSPAATVISAGSAIPTSGGWVEFTTDATPWAKCAVFGSNPGTAPVDIFIDPAVIR